MSERGRIVSFSREQGFGKVLVGEQELVFDASTIVDGHLPAPGESVTVEIGKGLRGPKVVALRSDVPATKDEPPLSVEEAVALLREHGIAASFDDEALDRAMTELEDPDASLGDLLSFHYEESRDASIADGAFVCDWRFGGVTDDVFRDLSARVGTALLEQIENDTDRGVIRARTRDGRELRFDFRGANAGSLGDIARAFDDELARTGDPRRFFSITTDSDFFFFLLIRPEAALALRRARVLRFDAHPALGDRT